jgi:MOSC domain-containing protein YiiM
MDDPVLVSIQVGMPKAHVDERREGRVNRVWTSGIFKQPVEGSIWLSRTNLAGDGQADLSVHGGPDKAVYAYPAAHYPFWRAELPEFEWSFGAFGENFTITGLTEESVCIDDVYVVGEARLQVSQPRQPCWKLARRLQIRDIGVRMMLTGYSGWYLRVLNESFVQAGLPVILEERPYPDWTIARVNRQLLQSM